MGLRSAIEADRAALNVLQRSLQAFGATKLGTSVFSVVMDPLDRMSHKLTKGRLIVGRKLGGLPVALLTTTGARSGASRTTAVNVIPVGEDVALVATNYGRGKAPGWAHNLRSTPNAVVNYGGTDFDVVATEVDGQRYEDAFDAAVAVYPGYAGYRRRATNAIPVFVLTEES